jgi:hypothetical protein
MPTGGYRMNVFLDMIHKSNKKHFIGDLKCCGETPDYVFKDIFVLKKMPSLSIRCDKCNKEKTMYLNKNIKFHCEDPTLLEAIKILKSKWNEE